VRLYGAAQVQAEQMGYHREPMDEAFLPPLLARARKALGEAAFSASEAAGRALSYDEAVAEIRDWLERPDQDNALLEGGSDSSPTADLERS
jgi:hypothetical protein